MKKYILSSLILLFYFSASLYAQNDTLWYDSNWNKTKKNNASFYRSEVVKKGNSYWFVDYYISGSKQMEGLSSDPDKEVYQGVIKWYHENGKVFQNVNYNNGILNGKRQVYFENGNLKSEETYKDGKKEGKWKSWYEDGNIKETGFFENGQKEGLWKTYYTNGKIKNEGKYVFDRKVDTWKTNYYDGTLQNQ